MRQVVGKNPRYAVKQAWTKVSGYSHLSFSSSRPREVTLSAQMNSYCNGQFEHQWHARIKERFAEACLELNCSRTIFIKHIEHIIRKLCGITKREELLVDLDEFRLVQLSRRAVLDETLVPLLQLFSVDWITNQRQQPATGDKDHSG